MTRSEIKSGTYLLGRAVVFIDIHLEFWAFMTIYYPQSLENDYTDRYYFSTVSHSTLWIAGDVMQILEDINPSTRLC